MNNTNINSRSFQDHSNYILEGNGCNDHRPLFLQGHSIQIIPSGQDPDDIRSREIVEAFRAALQTTYGAHITNFAFPPATINALGKWPGSRRSNS